MNILAIDPGTTESGWCLYNGRAVIDSGVLKNADMLHAISVCSERGTVDRLAIEMIASYGMPVGREVFETVWWIGRFTQVWHDPSDVMRLYRQEVKLHLCKSPRAKDPNVRQALIDLFPPTGGGKTPQIGTKAQPGPLFGVSSHVWAALGVAVTAQAKITREIV
jgi:hypothetical protein